MTKSLKLILSALCLVVLTNCVSTGSNTKPETTKSSKAAKAQKAKKPKDFLAGLTEEQKTEIRRRAKAECIKSIPGTAQFERIVLFPSGNYRCYYRH